MTRTIAIRRAELADVEAITAIYNEAIQTTTATFDTDLKSVEDRRQWLESHGDRYPVLVAMLDGAVVGWASLRAYPNTNPQRQQGTVTYLRDLAYASGYNGSSGFRIGSKQVVGAPGLQ